MSSVYFYIGVIGFAVGVIVASLCAINFAYVVWMILLSVVIGLIAYVHSKKVSSNNLVLISLALLMVSLGMFRFEFASQNVVAEKYEVLVGTEVLLEGVVKREPDIREKTTHLYVQVEDELLLVKTHRYVDVSYGDLIAIEGDFSMPESFETDLGRVFNYPEYLHARGVSYTVSRGEIAVLESGGGNIFIREILSIKQRFMTSIESVIPEPQVGLAEGLLLGVKQALGDELEEVFRKTGIIHIVVLSGYNVMLVVIFITYVLSYVLPYRARVPFGILAIICFAILVGLSATVVRASIMASLILFARATGRTYAVMRALCFAGVVMVLMNPYLLVYDVGFQLSFLATLGLIFLSPHIEQRLKFMPTVFGMREFLTATVATQIFVMPILLYSIGEFSLVSVIVNVLVLPMVPVAMMLTFITGLVGLVSVKVALLFAVLTHVSLSYILVVATFFAKVPFAAFSVPAFPFWVVIAGYTCMGYILFRLSVGKISTKVILPQWTLEEEDGLKKKLDTVSKKETVSSDTPIFFR